MIGIILIFLSIILMASAAHASDPSKAVVIININGEIDSGASAELSSALKGVTSSSVEAVILNINSTGGILAPMESMLSAINSTENANVPVYAYIGNGAYATSAASYLAIASNITYMGSNSFIGAARPVAGVSVSQSALLSQLEAQMEYLGELHHHNPRFDITMVSANAAFNEANATEYGIVNGFAPSLSAFISEMNLSSFKTVTINENSYDQFLSVLSDSFIDGILILGGVVCLLFDIFHATIAISIVGVALIALGVFGLDLVSGNIIGILLLIMGAALIMVELKTGHGIALAIGLIVGLIGAFLLTPDYISSNVYNPASPFTTSNLIFAGLIVAIGGFLVYYFRYIFKSLLGRVQTGVESMLGKIATCKTDLNPTGWVSLDGVQWQAKMVGDGTAKKGDNVMVKGVEGLVLFVDVAKLDDKDGNNSSAN